MELCLCQLFRVLLADLPLCGGALHKLSQVGNIERLRNIVESVQTQACEHRFIGGITSDDDDLDRGVDGLYFFQDLHAGESWHTEVEENDIDGLLLDEL